MKKAIPKIDRDILERLPLVEKAFPRYLIQKGELILDFSRNDLFDGGGVKIVIYRYTINKIFLVVKKST